MNTIHGCRPTLLREGFLNAGIADGAVLIFSELMDSASFFLTGNADTVYLWGFVDLSDGSAGCADSGRNLGCHRRHVVSTGSPNSVSPGADRGKGGTYLLTP